MEITYLSIYYFDVQSIHEFSATLIYRLIVWNFYKNTVGFNFVHHLDHTTECTASLLDIAPGRAC